MNSPPPYDIAVKLFDQSDLRIRTQYDFLDLWNQISATILYIFRNPFESINVQPTYSKVYYLAAHPCNKVPILVRGTQNEQIKTQDEISLQGLVLYYLFKELIRTQYKNFCEELKTATIEDFISIYISKWSCINAAMEKISAIFNYLQDHWHFHMQSNTPCFNTCNIMMSLLVEVVMLPLRDIFIESIVNIVNLEKQRRSVKGMSLIRDILGFLIRFETLNRNIYNDFFLVPFLKSIEFQFEKTFGTKFGTIPLVLYLDEIYEAIEKEEEFAKICLHKGTDNEIRRCIVSCTILPYQDKIIDESMSWISGDKKNLRSLGLLYGLISNFGVTCEIFCGKFCNYIWQYALNKISSLDKTKVEIDQSLLLKTEMDIFSEFESIIIETFINKTNPDSNNCIEPVMSALSIAAAKFLNINEFHPSERSIPRASWYFVRFLHALLCQYSVNLTHSNYKFSLRFKEDDERFNEQIRIISLLFIHIIDKEGFKMLYQQYLAYRLAFTNFSYEKEDYMIKQIRQQTSPDFVHKWRMMLEEARAFSNPTSLYSIGQYFRTTICDYYCWPSVATLEIEPRDEKGIFIDNAVNIPPFFKPFYISLTSLHDTYLKKNKHKILHWVPFSTFAVIKLNPNGSGIKNPINVNVSFVQVFILSFFVNRSDKTNNSVKISDIVQKLVLMINNRNEIQLNFIEVVASAIEPLLESKLLIFADQSNDTTEDKAKTFSPDKLNSMTVSFNEDFTPPWRVGKRQQLNHINSNINKNENSDDNLDMFLHDTLFPSQGTGSYLHRGILNFCAPNRLASIEKSRKFALEAFVVKVIKGKKSCRLDELTKECKETFSHNKDSNVAEISQQHLNFNPDEAMIKEALEVLIEKSIIEREQDEPLLFRYNP